MEFHEIDTIGRIWIERVAALPSWHSSYEGRVLYLESDDSYWYGDDVGWKRLHHRGQLGTNAGGWNKGIYMDKRVLQGTNYQAHANHIAPSADNTYDLGHSSYRYANVYAVNFQGIATTATYADLAEKYTMPEEYPIGTVVGVSEDERYDLEQTRGMCASVIGVVSEKPGFLLNYEGEGQAVGMVGKLPVRVIGPVHKRDPLVATHNGCAMVKYGVKSKYIIGHSLETDTNHKERLIMSVIK
jgi:hypothetical protein